ncbi:MAG TPA: OmpA family protein [Flavobacteriales bacterium]|nr:OmpA family protein [Flavobacteriales bacterium]
MRTTKTLLIAAAALLAGCAQQRLAQADRAYDRMAYDDAVRLYAKALPQLADRDATLRAADANVKINRLADAASLYAKAEAMQPLSGADALAHGRTLLGLGRAAEASKPLERVLIDQPEDPIARELGFAIADRDAFYADSTLFTITPLHIDGLRSAFSAIPMDDKLIVSGEKEAPGNKANPWNGAAFLDLFTVKPGQGIMAGSATPLPGEVNGRFHDGPAVLSADGRTMYFTRSDYFRFRLNKDGHGTSHLMLFRAELQPDGQWGKVSSFAYNGEDFSAGHAALSADGSALYYVSDMPGGFGGTDLYVCERNANGWGLPRNLGPTVNTPGNEMFPTMRGDTMYFSSNGHRSLGGLDIFRSVMRNGDWSAPENLNYPINTQHDDFALVMLDGGKGYLSSNRAGQDGIYRFQENSPTLVLNISVFDMDNGSPMAGAEVRLLEPTKTDPLTLFTNDDGQVSFPLTVEKLYEVLASKDGVFTERRTVDTRGQRISKTYDEEFRMQRVVIDKPIVIENIYYDYDKWDIRPDAAVELDKIAQVFIDNPNLSFELGSHTDSRASDTYNLLLSDMRAKSAVDYLIQNGVPSERITARGYGERKLVNRCKDGVECSEEEHQANRRTEFKVVKVIPMMSERR